MFVTSAALNNLQVDGVYVYDQPPTAIPSQGIPTSLAGMVGTAAWNELNVPVGFGSQGSEFAAFGSMADCGEDPYSITTEAYLATALSNNFLGVRVSDQTDLAATGQILDTGASNGVVFTAFYTGATGNSISISFATGSNSTVSVPTLTATVQRSGYAPEIYPNLGNSSVGSFQANLINAINNGISGVRGPSALVLASALGTSAVNFAVTSQPVFLSGGTNGSLFPAAPSAASAPTVAYTGTAGSTEYQYQVVASGNGDASPSTAGSVSSAASTLTGSAYNTVTWTAVSGAVRYKILRQVGGTGGYFLIATVSAGTLSIKDSGEYTPSAYNAASNVSASQSQYGTNGISARTGVFALQGTGVQQFILCGNSDTTQFANLATFAQSIGSLAIVTFESGTNTPTAISGKQTANYNSQFGACLKDWVYFNDPNTGSLRLVSPLGEALGLIASLPPWKSPGNKPVGGLTNINGTERTGTPYEYTEAQELQSAGILYFTNPIPRGSIFGFAHGENASAAVVGVQAVTDNINYTRMMNYLGASVVAFLGPYVDELQGTSANDPTRAAASNTLTQWLSGLQKQGVIDNYQVTLDLTNNTPLTIAQGYCLALVQVALMNTIKFFLVTLEGGSAVQLSFGNVPQQQAA